MLRFDIIIERLKEMNSELEQFKIASNYCPEFDGKKQEQIKDAISVLFNLNEGENRQIELRDELIEFLEDWYKENPFIGVDKIEKMVDEYLIRKSKLKI